MNRKKTSKAALVAVAVMLIALLAVCLAACDNEPAKPVLGVTVHSQEAPYSPDGAKPFTDGTYADIEGLPEGYDLQIGLSAEFDGIPQAGESAPLVWDGTVKVMNGDVDVTAEFDVQLTIDDGATFTVVKADMDFGNLFVGTEYDGKAHSFNEFAEQLALPDGAEQTEYIIEGGDKTYTAGGEYPVEITFAETANYNEQTVIGRLCIRTFTDAEGNYYSISEASDAAAKSADGLTVYMFEDTSVGMDTVVGAGLTVVLRDARTSVDGCDNSDKVGVPTYNSKSVTNHIDGDPNMIESTLSVEADAELQIDGAVIVSGILGSAGQGLEGHTSGTHSVLSVKGSVTVADGGVLDVRGYVRGEGTVEAFDGSTVYLPFVVYDFRGGTNTTTVYMKGNVIPFNTYEMFYNLQVDTTVNYGAKFVAYLDLYASGNHNTAQVFSVDAFENGNEEESAFYRLKEGAKLFIDFVNEKSSFMKIDVAGYTCVNLIGNITLGELSLKVMGVEVSLSDVQLAFSHRFKWVIGDGGTPTDVVMPHDYKLLPGSELIVKENAVMTIEKSLIVYDEFIDDSPRFIGEKFSGAKYPSDMPAALFRVNGTVMFADGAAFGGRIVSESSGAVVQTEASFTSVVSSKEGTSGDTSRFEAILMQGTFYKEFEITETARFDEGSVTKTDTPKSYGDDVKYTEHIVIYDSESPIQANSTYTYDAASGSWS